MAPARHIALWLAAAIISIVMALAPSAAEAHGAGLHPQRATTHGTGHRDGVEVSERAGQSGLTVTGVGATPACHCPGCAHGGAGCCTVGLAPAADCALPSPRPIGQAASRDGPIPVGIVPEALPEPPRSLA